MKKIISMMCCFLIASCASSPSYSKSMKTTSNLSYTVSGNPQGTPVVFVHAFPLNQSMWDEQAKFLQDSARVITLDIRGLGKSQQTSPYTLEFVVDDLIEVLNEQKIDKAVVCGLSMGGYVALRAVQRNPERFMGLILADTKSESDSDKAKLSRYQALKDIQSKGLSVYVDAFLKNSIAQGNPRSLVSFEKAKAVAEINSEAGVSAAVLALISRTDTTAGLKAINVPTLVLHGEQDTVIPEAAARALHEQIAGSTFVIIPKAGHLSNLENPDAFNAELKSFLSKLK